LRFSSTNSQLRRSSDRTAEGGYILLVLLLFVAILTIAAAAIAPSIAFQVRRDREEEMIHRGVQYSRAVRHYYKKFNRYPSKIEDLEDTNNYRSLRKRYKDPITGADFKVLHLSEVQMALGGGAVGGLTPPGTNPGAGANGQFGQSASAFGFYGRHGCDRHRCSRPFRSIRIWRHRRWGETARRR
jgi:type II secretory pathway pseudopilin PulG